MSERRMFSKRLCSSARFLKMPFDSQLLYYHLALHADDDGVVEAFQVMRMTGASEDNLRVLAAKNLVKVLNDDMVTWITDWQEHNYIRADRLKPSMYRPLLIQLMPDIELPEPKQRSDVKSNNPNQIGYDGEESGPSMDGVEERESSGSQSKVGEKEGTSSSAAPVTKERIEQALSRDKGIPDKDMYFLNSVLHILDVNKALSEDQEKWLKDAIARSDRRMKDIYEAERIRNRPGPPLTIFFDKDGNYLSDRHERAHKAQQEREKAEAAV